MLLSTAPTDGPAPPACPRSCSFTLPTPTNNHQAILRAVLDAGYSAANVAFGMGGGLLQKVRHWQDACFRNL